MTSTLDSEVQGGKILGMICRPSRLAKYIIGVQLFGPGRNISILRMDIKRVASKYSILPWLIATTCDYSRPFAVI